MDANGKGIRVVLMQKGRPIVFLSKQLCPRNQVLSIYEMEFLTILLAIQKLRRYVQGHHFIIRTGQQSLKFLLEHKITSTLQHKWVTKLLGLDYEIQYKQGTTNRVVDALSRRGGNERELASITTLKPL